VLVSASSVSAVTHVVVLIVAITEINSEDFSSLAMLFLISSEVSLVRAAK